jgi:hypothetical protein
MIGRFRRERFGSVWQAITAWISSKNWHNKNIFINILKTF